MNARPCGASSRDARARCGLVLLAAWCMACAGAGAAGQASSPSASEPDSQSAGAGVAVSDAQPRAGAPRGPKPTDFVLEDLDGGSVRLSEHLGKDVVLIDFWATYCDPCLAAMPHLNELYRSHRDRGLVILGVSIDGPESIAQVRTTVTKLGVEFPILLDDESSVVAKYNPKLSAPYSVLIGRDGTIITAREGYTVGKHEQLEADVERALAAP